MSNGVIATVAGTGIQGYNGEDLDATQAEISNPLGLTVSPTGELYIADSGNNLVRKISNRVLTTVLSYLLRTPASVAVDDNGTVYTADEDNGRLLALSNQVVTTLVGVGMRYFGGDGGSAINALMDRPTGVAVDSRGAIYIADSGNYRVRKISNGTITTLAGGGSMRGENIPATSADLSRPDGTICQLMRVAVDMADNLYIGNACTNRVYEVSNGIISTVAGADGLINPWDIAVDSGGDLYIADRANYRVWKVTNGIVTTVAGNGTTASGGDNLPAASALLGGWPNAIAVDALGNLYIGQGGDQRIRKVSNGIITTIASGGGEYEGIAVDFAGNIYVAENMNVDKIINGDLVTIVRGPVSGLNDDDGPTNNGSSFYPAGLAADSSGNIYAVDLGNKRIRVIVPQNGSGDFTGATPTRASWTHEAAVGALEVACSTHERSRTVSPFPSVHGPSGGQQLVARPVRSGRSLLMDDRRDPEGSSAQLSR